MAQGRAEVIQSSAHLGEVAHDVEALTVVLRHDVEQEGVCVVVQRLVVEEALGQETQVLGITLQRKRPISTLGPCVKCGHLAAAPKADR